MIDTSLVSDQNTVIKPESVLQHIGSPPEFGVVLLLVTFALAVTPYLAGADFGAIKIPTFEKQPRLKKRLRILGPLALALALILHAPLFPQARKISDEPPVTATADPIKPVPAATDTPVDVTRTEPATGSMSTHSGSSEPTIRSSSSDAPAANASSAIAPTNYKVTLLIPTSMSNAEVSVDGREATITHRTEISIQISVPASPGNRHIEISRDGTKPCKTTIAITKDTSLTPCS